MQDKAFIYKKTAEGTPGELLTSAYLLDDNFFIHPSSAYHYLVDGCGFSAIDATLYMAELNKEALNQPILPVFATYEYAVAWMEQPEQAGDPCMDNYRFAYDDDATALAEYDRLRSNGCCAFFDEDIIVAGRLAHIGCNFGH